jgi:hypothetical protein
VLGLRGVGEYIGRATYFERGVAGHGLPGPNTEPEGASQLHNIIDVRWIRHQIPLALGERPE